MESENIMHVREEPNGPTNVIDITHPNAPFFLQQLGVDLDSLRNFGIHLQSQEQAQSQPSTLSEAPTTVPEALPNLPASPSHSATPPPTDFSRLQAISFGSRSKEDIRKAASSPPVAVTPPPKMAINRWGDEKPPLTFPGLTALVLEDLPNGHGTLQEIFRHITKHFPYYAKSTSLSWQKSISHALSFNKEFDRTGGRKKGGMWTISPGANKAALMRIKGHEQFAQFAQRFTPSSNTLQPSMNDPWKNLSTPATASKSRASSMGMASSTVASAAAGSTSLAEAGSSAAVASASSAAPSPVPTETNWQFPTETNSQFSSESNEAAEDFVRPPNPVSPSTARAEFQEKAEQMKKFLLMQIEEYPALYRQDHPCYKEKTTVGRRAWEEILSTLKKKYEEELIAHGLSTVPDLMAAFASLKAKLKQVVNANKKRTGMSASEVTPITWEFYHSMEFLRHVSEPLPTQSSVDGFDVSMDDAGDGSSSGPKWDPIQEKKRRSIMAKEQKKWASSKAEERKSEKHDEVKATLAAARSALAGFEKKQDKRDSDGPKEKRQKVEEDDEVAASFKYLGTRIRQVLHYFPNLTHIVPYF